MENVHNDQNIDTQRTVTDAMVICGLTQEDAEVISQNIFQDNFRTCS